MSARARNIRDLLSSRHLPALDGLRAVAVMMVIAGHFTGISFADLGVSVFFVLSGFLITSLLLREYREVGTISLRRFYLRRTLRIFPAYYAFLAFTFAADWLLGDRRAFDSILPALLYFMNYFNAIHGHPPTSVAHAWSLAVEEQFYLAWPLAFLLLARHGRIVLVRGVIVIILAVLVWRCVAWYLLQVGTAWVYNAFDCRFDNLAVGCLLAIVADRAWFANLATKVAASQSLPIVTITLILTSRFGLPETWHYGPGFTVDALLIGILIIQLLQLSSTAYWRWLDHRSVRFLGAISYPMYLYHQWGLGLGDTIEHLTVLMHFVLGTAITIGFASGSYYMIERPFLRLKDRLENRWRHSRSTHLRVDTV